MEDWIRVSAKTVADAITEATIQLGTSSDNMEYRVIEKGTAGFFGIGAKKAVIEAKKKKTDEDLMKEVFGDLEEKPKRDSRKEPKKDKKESREASASKEVKEAAEIKAPEKAAELSESGESKKEVKKEQKEFKKEFKKEEKKNFKEGKREAGREVRRENKPVKEAAEPTDETAKEESQENGGRYGRRENYRDGRRNGQRNSRKYSYRENWKEGEAQPEEKTASDGQILESGFEVDKERAPKAPKVPADPEEAKRRAESFLNDLFRTMEMQVQMQFSFEDDVLSVNIDGDEMGILIGKRGQTLDSLQYLTSLVVNKGNASYVRVKLDTEDYRNRRKATLENLAKNIAAKVKKTRRPVFLEPMNPYERRIIHSALQNDPYVTTHSEGEEPCRKVVVTLRKNNNDRDRYERRPQRAERRRETRAAVEEVMQQQETTAAAEQTTEE
jgi:spoIIIJ-associated protein